MKRRLKLRMAGRIPKQSMFRWHGLEFERRTADWDASLANL
jgi:hypothetical protein